MSSICYVCEQEVIKPYGYSQADVLIIGDAPGKEELGQMKPFVGQTGQVLRKEMALVGFDLFRAKLVNLWFHAPNKNEECFKASLDVVLQEAKGKKAILLVGSEPCEYFTGYKVSDVSGLQVDCNMLSAPIIYAMVMPTIVFKSRGVGEVRFAIENFVTHIKKEGII